MTPGLYRHYKGQEYVVLGVAQHSESGEQLVVYRQNYEPFGLWVRPLAMFCEQVVVSGKPVSRFALIQPDSAV